MIRRLPAGLVRFGDCGLARHPFARLAGEAVRVDCGVGRDDGRPMLVLCVDGGPEREIARESTDGRHYHFELGGWSETRVVAVFSIITAILCLIAYLGL